MKNYISSKFIDFLKKFQADVVDERALVEEIENTKLENTDSDGDVEESK
jgi:hypothetical protein